MQIVSFLLELVLVLPYQIRQHSALQLNSHKESNEKLLKDLMELLQLFHFDQD